MTLRIPAGLFVFLGCLGGFAAGAEPRALTFAERVEAQAAIERVYYRHQIGATKPFDQAVPRALIETKVRTYLKETSALERIWRTPVTEAMLERELQRMSRGSRMPERLNELYDALGNNPEVILECLVRPALVHRLTENFFDYDQTIHSGARAEAEAVRSELASGVRNALVADERRTPIDLTRDDTTGPPDRRVTSAQFERISAEVPRNAGEAGPVIERSDSFTVSVLVSRTANRLQAAVYRIPKRTREDWWASVESGLSISPRISVPKWVRGAASVIEPAIPQTCPVNDAWEPTLDDAPEWRTQHSAVWTGSEMIVWGGYKPFFPLNHPGLRYDPATDTWSPTATSSAPAVDYSGQRAVWAGGRVVVVGNGKGVYDPVSDSWSNVSGLNAASGGEDHTVVAVGNAVVVWGGTGIAAGKRYDWATDTWTTISTVNAPMARSGHTAVSTGTRMLVWGGADDSGIYLETGGVYDVAGDTWTSMSNTGPPIARIGHTAVWAGDRMLVWGGLDKNGLLRNDGGRFDPVTNTWTTLTGDSAPTPRTAHSAVWSGGQMLVWGGNDVFTPALGTGGRYDPATDRWTPISTANAPSPRREQSAVWTGDRMIVWGGNTGGDHVLNTGGRYDPATDTWTPTSVGGTPLGRSLHTSIWTGSRMVVWGGYDQVAAPTDLDSGGRYDPATDTWSPTSRSGAPLARNSHTAIWTGSVMVVWGGYASTGGRYDPIADTWAPTSLVGAPTGTYYHTAVWTGSSMVVWGGFNGSFAKVNTGGRYDPVSDTWLATSVAGAPTARASHAAAWTGQQMVVWGGGDFTTSLDTGGRYNPLTDTWTATSTVGAPSARTAATAVWTGTKVIIWGGLAGHYNAFDTGGRYDPIADAWSATSTTGAPARRFEHSAIWTGHEMIVWGGVAYYDLLDNSGGRYDPTIDSWTPTSGVNVPAGRHQHTAVWTGGEMLVFGGSGNEGGREDFSSGGIYHVEYDTDGDGYTACQGDCDDARAATHPGATETCNGIDDNCSGQADEDALGLDSDGDGVRNACDDCRSAFNSAQSDVDHDGEGDACDLNDGIIYIFANDKNYREWQPEAGFTGWNSYRGSLSVLRATGEYTQLPGSNPLAARDCGLSAPSVFDPQAPSPGEVAFSLVTGVAGGIESGLGTNSAGAPRPNTHPCP